MHRRTCAYCKSKVEYPVTIPENSYLRREWLNSLNLTENELSARSFICPSHFLTSDIVAKRKSVTTVRHGAIPFPKGMEPAENDVNMDRKKDLVANFLNSLSDKEKSGCEIFLRMVVVQFKNDNPREAVDEVDLRFSCILEWLVSLVFSMNYVIINLLYR